MGMVLQSIAALIEQNELDQAMALIERMVGQAEHQQDAICGMAALAFRQGRLSQAIQLLEPLARMDGLPSDVPEILAILNCMAGRLTDGLFYAKFAASTPLTNEVIPLFGPLLPSFLSVLQSFHERPLLVQARRHLHLDQNEDAAAALEQHLLLFPNDADALDAYGAALCKLNRHREAIAILRSAMTIAGPSATVFNRLGQCLVALGQVEDGLSCHRQAVATAPRNWSYLSGLLRDWDYSPWRASAPWRASIAQLEAYLAETAPSKPPLPCSPRSSSLLTIGILCSGLLDADTKWMLSRLARAFDRMTCKVVGFGYGDMMLALNAPFRDAFDVWRNTSDVDELTLATLIRGEGVDVLLDADGLLSPGRFGILRRHCAPLQLQWLNVVDGWDRAGSHGDLCQSPVGSLLLEGGEAVSDAETPDPTAGIVFAADVTLAELNSEVIALWSAILHAVPDATLVLRDYDFAHPETVDRLITAFGNYGVSHRIEIAQDKDGAAVFAGAHIALAPFPQLRPMAYAPALSQGVPVVLLNESATCNRFAQSLAALPHGADGISTSLAQYVDIATQWAKNPDVLLSKRQALQMDCRQSPLFNATDMAARLEEHFRLCLSKIAQG